MKFAKEYGYKYFFHFQELVFTIMGIDITAREKLIKRPFAFYFPLSNMFVLLFLVFAFCWDNRHDADPLTDAMNHAIMGSLIFFKLGTFVKRQKLNLKLIHTLCELVRTNDPEERAIVAESNKTVTYVSICYFFTGYFTFISGLFVPILHMAVVYWKTGEMVYILPMKANFYIDHRSLGNIICIYLWIILAMYMASTGTIAMDTLYAWIILNIKAQYQLLNLRLKRAATLSNESEINNAILDCIRNHQKIIELTEDFNFIFRPIIFVQFALCCLLLCFICFQLTSGTGYAAYYGIYIMSVLVMISIFCIGGQIIQDESYSVSETIYAEFPWERLSKKSKKLLLISMLRAQKSCNITGIFFVVDIELLVWVYSTTVSYVTILWTIDANTKN